MNAVQALKQKKEASRKEKTMNPTQVRIRMNAVQALKRGPSPACAGE
jgi:hypothetical protein